MLRPGVEATMKEFKTRTNNGKVKVRGLFKTSIFAFTIGIAINFGRIFRYLMDKSFDLVWTKSQDNLFQKEIIFS